jgi:hypothetical protein
MAMGRYSACALGLLGLFVVGSCGGGIANPSGDLCGRAIAKLDSCGFSKWTASPSFECEDPADAEDRCQGECIVTASCDVLSDLLCGVSLPPSLLQCVAQCEPPPFRCADGQMVDSDYRCDGYSDCGDGSDEAGCPMLTCGDGSQVSEAFRCDGHPNCADGADEAGCPTEPVFDCGDGTTIPKSFECDGDLDCPNGADEPPTCEPNPLEAACAALGKG